MSVLSPLSSNDIRFYLSGGIDNTNPNLSLGGPRSIQTIVNDVLDNVFDNVDKIEADAGDTEFRCIYVKNVHPTDTMVNMVMYLSDGTDSAEDTVFFGLGTSCIGAIEQGPFPSENLAPAGVIFGNGKKRADGYLIGNLSAGTHKAIWLKRVVDPSAGTFKRNKFKLRFEMTPGSSTVPCNTGFHRNEQGVCVPNDPNIPPPPPPGPNPPPPAPPPAPPVISYTYESKFGSEGSGNGQFRDPHDISFDAVGNLFVCDRVRNDIQKFTHTGAYISKFGSAGSGNGQFDVPYAIQHTPDYTHIYVCDRENNRIQKLDATGAYVSKITTVNGQALNKPEDITFDKTNGDMYICDTGNNRVVKLDQDHTFILQWGTSGSGDGQFTHNHSINTDSARNVFVSCGDQAYIQKFTPNGVFIKKFGTDGTGPGQTQQFLEHMDIDVFNRVHLINNDSRPIINVWDTDGNWITQYGKTTSGSANGQFKEPEHVTVYSDGKPFVVDAMNFRIQVFSVNVVNPPPPPPPPPTPECPTGQHKDANNNCVQNCQSGFHNHPTTGVCVPNCPIGKHNDPVTGECVDDNPNPPPPVSEFTFTTVGDNDCGSGDAKTIVNKMIARNPDFHLQLGDYSYTSSGGCYSTLLGSLKSKTKNCCIGNHDDAEEESNNLRSSYLSDFGFSNPWHATIIRNVFVLTLYNTTQADNSSGAAQYTFAEQQLSAAATNPNVLWRIIIAHKPHYGAKPSGGHAANEGGDRNIVHQLADKYKVDFVLSGHNHCYGRTFPLKFNSANTSVPTIVSSLTTGYINLVNPIFMTIGCGGRSNDSSSTKQACEVDTRFFGHGYCWFIASDGGRKFTVRLYDKNDSLKDEFTVQKTFPSSSGSAVLGSTIDIDTQVALADCGGQNPCPSGQHLNTAGQCVPDDVPVPCPTGTHQDTVTGKCVPDVVVHPPQSTVFRYATCRGSGTGTNPVQFITYVLSHEIVEALTDPDTSGFGFGGRTRTWNEPSTGFEVCDGPCQVPSTIYGTTPNDLRVNTYWSNSDGICLAPGIINSGPGVNNKMKWGGGLIIKNAKIFLIFWGSNWITRISPSMAEIIEKIQIKLLQTYTTYFSKLGQYTGSNGSISTPTWGGTCVNTTFPLPPSGQGAQASQIHSVIKDSINRGSLPFPAPVNDDIYIVQCPIGLGLDLADVGFEPDPGLGGFHAAFIATVGTGLPPPPASGNDQFGIKKIYATKGGGDEFFFNDANPEADGRFDWGSNPAAHHKLNGEAGWNFSDDNPRIHIFTAGNGEHNLPQNPARGNGSGSKMKGGFNFANLKTQGYWYQERDWKNIELTLHVRIQSVDSDSEGFGFSIRSVRHDNSTAKPGGLCCGGSSYHCNFHHADGTFRFRKEDWHANYESTDYNKTNKIGNVDKKWFGYKFVCYNTLDGKNVVMEAWVDKDCTNNWVLAHSFRDTGNGDFPQGSHAMDKCGSSKSGDIISWGSPEIICFKNNNGLNADFRYMSCREISPPS